MSDPEMMIDLKMRESLVDVTVVLFKAQLIVQGESEMFEECASGQSSSFQTASSFWHSS